MTAQTKVFEIRDEGTCIVAIGIKPDSRDDEDARWCWARSGYGTHPNDQGKYVLLAPLNGGEGYLTCDPFKHPGQARTMRVAHEYIRDMWYELGNGDVIDVQFILNETETCKRPEREEVLAKYYELPHGGAGRE